MREIAPAPELDVDSVELSSPVTLGGSGVVSAAILSVADAPAPSAGPTEVSITATAARSNAMTIARRPPDRGDTWEPGRGFTTWRYSAAEPAR